MPQSPGMLLPTVHKLVDLAVLIGCFVFSAAITGNDIEPEPLMNILSIHVKIFEAIVFLSFLCLWHFILVFFGVYTACSFTNPHTEAYALAKSIGVITAITYISGKVARDQLICNEMIVIFGITSFLLCLINRYASRLIISKISRFGINAKYVLLIGTNQRSTDMAQSILDRPEHGYRLVGFVDDDWTRLGDGMENVRRACDFAGLPEFLRNNIVDEVYISLPIRSFYDTISKIVTTCEEQGIAIRFVPEVCNMGIGKATVQQTEEHGIRAVYTGRRGDGRIVLKSFIDTILATLLLGMLAPLLLISAILIKLTSPGPVFFVQKRVGLNKRIFSLYKFRTMVVDAEEKLEQLENLNEVDGPVFKIRNDPRVTAIGKFLRRTSLDELPQLLNVLKGEMSIVGPRPLPVRDYKSFNTDWHRRRFSVRPGMTCLWQICGRSNTQFSDWMKLDMQYIDNWSIWLDIKILLKTIPVVILGRGAH